MLPNNTILFTYRPAICLFALKIKRKKHIKSILSGCYIYTKMLFNESLMMNIQYLAVRRVITILCHCLSMLSSFHCIHRQQTHIDGHFVCCVCWPPIGNGRVEKMLVFGQFGWWFSNAFRAYFRPTRAYTTYDRVCVQMHNLSVFELKIGTVAWASHCLHIFFFVFICNTFYFLFSYPSFWFLCLSSVQFLYRFLLRRQLRRPPCFLYARFFVCII